MAPSTDTLGRALGGRSGCNRRDDNGRGSQAKGNQTQASHHSANRGARRIGIRVGKDNGAAENAGREAQKVETFVRTEKKVGRNDPCPCSSGKKYKQCHGKV